MAEFEKARRLLCLQSMMTHSEHAVICVQLGCHQDCDVVKKSSNVSQEVYARGELLY